MIGIAPNYHYGTASVYSSPVRFGASVRTGSVLPVTPTPFVNATGPWVRMPAAWPNPGGGRLPEIREGVDPVEMAVRGRIQYLEPYQTKDPANTPASGSAIDGEGKKSPQETMEEGECQTCKNRKYQDGSNDPGVSFKTATRLSPEQAATAVRGHEMEHVSHERARAEREDRKVVQQSVTIHTAVCPECGDVYVSGGTTRTTTKKDNRQELAQQARQAMLGPIIDTVA